MPALTQRGKDATATVVAVSLALRHHGLQVGLTSEGITSGLLCPGSYARHNKAGMNVNETLVKA